LKKGVKPGVMSRYYDARISPGKGGQMIFKDTRQHTKGRIFAVRRTSFKRESVQGTAPMLARRLAFRRSPRGGGKERRLVEKPLEREGRKMSESKKADGKKEGQAESGKGSSQGVTRYSTRKKEKKADDMCQAVGILRRKSLLSIRGHDSRLFSGHESHPIYQSLKGEERFLNQASGGECKLRKGLFPEKRNKDHSSREEAASYYRAGKKPSPLA